MSRALIAMAIAACNSHGSSSTLLVDGLVIGIAEGEQRAFQLDRTGVSLMNPPPALGASIVGDQLVLNVGCDAVPGTAGPTRELELALEAGGEVTVATVEVQPSGLPPCLPTVLACLHTLPTSMQGTGRAPCSEGGMPSTRGDAAIDGTTADKCMMGEIINGTRIEFDYLDSLQFSELGLPDRALLFHLANPDSTDAGLNFVVTTDGPLKVLPSNNGTDVCASLANSNIVGTFILDYAIVRGMAASDPLVAAGTWELGWNKRGIGAQAIFEKYGLEVTGCSTDDPMSGCTPSRQSAQQPQQPQWCIPARTGDSTSIKMRLWASPAPGVKSYGINLSAQWSATGPPIVLDADGHRGPTFKVVASQTSIPIDVQMDVGNGTGDLTVTVDGDDTSPSYGPSHDLLLHVGGMCQ